MTARPAAPLSPSTPAGQSLAAMPCYASSCGRVTLYQCEAREIVPKLKDIDAVVTDPPYAVTSQASSEVSRTTRQTRETQFFEAWLREELGRFLLCCKPSAAWWMTIDWRGAMVLDTVCARLNLKEPKVGVWDKESIGMGGILRNSYECFAVVTLPEWKNFTRSEPDVWRHRWTQGNRDSEHPAEKPVTLFTRALDLVSPKGATVLDPYMGSGTAGIACIRSGRRFIGIERDPERFAEAKARIINELAKGDLFLGHNVDYTWEDLKAGPHSTRIKRPGQDWQPCSKPAQ